MPDILIRGMEMPKDNDATSIIIFSNGKVSLAHDKKYAEYAEAVPLPEGHGELIDKQAFIADIDGFIECMTSVGAVVDGELLWGKLLDALANAKTIVPAEGGGEDG